ncbi:MAG: hypothetical protein JXO22_18050, partial [Phycisphaerae bacterium]|nr:hypothetical protein [Phycisphaerae bacterium]
NAVSELAGGIIGDAAQGMPSLTAAKEKAHLYEEIVSGIAAHVDEMQLAGRSIGDDTARLVLYPLNLTLPDDITSASMDMASVDPWSNLWQTMSPAAVSEPALDSAPAEVEEYSL